MSRVEKNTGCVCDAHGVKCLPQAVSSCEVDAEADLEAGAAAIAE
jgi:hypothetical protein